jgi:hypothetical protein
MKTKVYWLLLLALSCGSVTAAWVKVSSNEKSVFYMDSSVSKKVNEHVMIWMLRDHISLQYDRSAPYLSSKDELELDCSGGRIRRIYSSDHPQPMGAGKAIHTEHGPMSWNDVAPNTIIKRVLDIACARF